MHIIFLSFFTESLIIQKWNVKFKKLNKNDIINHKTIIKYIVNHHLSDLK